jgi:hypothetical protein
MCSFSLLHYGIFTVYLTLQCIGSQPSTSASRPMSWQEFQQLRTAAEVERQAGFISKKMKRTHSASSFNVSEEVTVWDILILIVTLHSVSRFLNAVPTYNLLCTEI